MNPDPRSSPRERAIALRLPSRWRALHASVGAVALSLGLVAAASAAVTLQLDGRNLFTSYISVCPSCGPNGEDEWYQLTDNATPALPFEEWSDSLFFNPGGTPAEAIQDSGATDTLLWGQGSAWSALSGGYEAAEARTTYRVRFALSEPTRFSLAGSLHAGLSFGGYTAAELSLYDLSRSSYVLLRSADSTSPTANAHGSGTLAPGQYEFHATARTDILGVDTPSTFDFSLQLGAAAVPASSAPMTLLLVVALAGLGATRLAPGRR